MCQKCERIYTTAEKIDYEKTWTVEYAEKTAKRPQKAPFVREKLLISIHSTIGHRDRPLNDALGLTDTIIGKLGHRGAVIDGNVTSTAIATLTLDTLKRFDNTAATVYQAYHADVL
jgi:transcriptional regulator NrdR family protein